MQNLTAMFHVRYSSIHDMQDWFNSLQRERQHSNRTNKIEKPVKVKGPVGWSGSISDRCIEQVPGSDLGDIDCYFPIRHFSWVLSVKLKFLLRWVPVFIFSVSFHHQVTFYPFERLIICKLHLDFYSSSRWIK